jgi:hypothetical protein
MIKHELINFGLNDMYKYNILIYLKNMDNCELQIEHFSVGVDL